MNNGVKVALIIAGALIICTLLVLFSIPMTRCVLTGGEWWERHPVSGLPTCWRH